MKIIARYNEDIGPEVLPHFIVQKGEHLPNEGREASSYLWYIINFWDELDGDYDFRQAKEWEHPVNDFSNLSDHDGYSEHPGLKIKEFSDKINLEIPEVLEFTRGAQFTVSTNKIKQRSKEWYNNLYELSMSEQQAPWILERLWKYIFNL